MEHTSGPANRSGLGVFHVSLFGLVTTSILSNGSLYQIPLKANGSHNRQKQACQSAVFAIDLFLKLLKFRGRYLLDIAILQQHLPPRRRASRLVTNYFLCRPAVGLQG